MSAPEFDPRQESAAKLEHAAQRASDDMPSVGVETLPHAVGLPPLAPATGGSSGYDLRAAVQEEIVIQPGCVRLVPAGIRLEIPPGFEAQVRARSGLALRAGIGVLNSPGTIDSDYRGEVQVLLVNLGDAPFRIGRGERIAQLVVQRVARARLIEVAGIAQTQRGAGGFGSTGVKRNATRKSSRPASRKSKRGRPAR